MASVNFAKITEFGSFGTGNDQFDDPRGLDSDGTFLYICDNGNNRVMKRDLVGNKLIVKAGDLNISGAPIASSTDIGFDSPEDLVIVNDFIYIADKNNDRVKIYDKDLKFRRSITDSDIADPIGITSDNHFLYVASAAKVVKISLIDYSVVKTAAIAAGGVKGIFYYKRNDFLYLTDRTNNKIIILNTSLESKRTITSSDSVDSMLNGLEGITIVDGYIHVVEQTRIQIFDTANHNSISTLTGLGDANGILSIGQFIYITDNTGDKIRINLNYSAYRGLSPRSARLIDTQVWYENPIIPIGGKQFGNNYTIGGTQEFDKKRWIDEDNDSNNVRWSKE
ncbi:MAG: hypothetical protein KAS32_24420 [Candidatus Peribacteraceae bacterium]|nr:hypothetical protein [Candidatus Peribacteraceae bacterium]